MKICSNSISTDFLNQAYRNFGHLLKDLVDREVDLDLQTVVWDHFHDAEKPYAYIMVKEFQQRRAFTRGTDG